MTSCRADSMTCGAHCLMTFEDSLMNLYGEPEAMNEFFAAYTDWKLQVVEQLIDNLQPDVIHTHDDWGSKDNLLFSPDVFRELFKPHYARLYGYIKERGVLVQHHADCYCQGIEKDMVDIGCDMWQGVLPTNDINKIIDKIEGEGDVSVNAQGVEEREEKHPVERLKELLE